jgi:hypothetical protein
MTVSRSVPLPPIDEWYALRVRWRDEKPSPGELRSLRMIHEGFRAMTIAGMMACLSSQAVICFGRYSFGEAEEVRRRAEQMGLRLEVGELRHDS